MAPKSCKECKSKKLTGTEFQVYYVCIALDPPKGVPVNGARWKDCPLAESTGLAKVRG